MMRNSQADWIRTPMTVDDFLTIAEWPAYTDKQKQSIADRLGAPCGLFPGITVEDIERVMRRVVV